MLNRRQLLATACTGALMLPGIRLHAQTPQRLNIMSHRVHRTVATGPQGGDITAAWTQRTGIAVEWTTFDTGPLQERLLREAALNETTVDIGFVLNTQMTPRVASLFEPLGPFMQAEAIEDQADIFPGLLAGMQAGGAQIGLPFRHASSGMHYNEEILAERGITSPPRTIEDFAEAVRRCTYTRNGQPVVGLVLDGVSYPNMVDLARAWDGDFITQDYRVVAHERGMVNAFTMIRALFEAGAFPRTFSTIRTEDVNTWMQQGRAAFSVSSMGRNAIFNNPQASQFAGKIKTTTIPIAREFQGRFEVAPAKVEFWGMAIPKSSRNKRTAWALMREIASKENTLKAALNGNGPVRNSTYDNARVRQNLPYADAERQVLRIARVPLPAFDEAQRAADIFREEGEAAVLGRKPVQQAMNDVTQRVTPLVASR